MKHEILVNSNFASVLFLSTGRTGTKFLASIMADTVPDADVYHEGGEQSRLINIASHLHAAGLAPLDVAEYAWRRKIKPALEIARGSKRYYIDANNHIYHLAVHRPELYPNLKVIHIVRDPRTYIRSHLNWSRSRMKSWLANNLTPYWQPTAPMVGERGLASWFRMSRLERFAWIWQYKNRIISKLEDSPVPYLLVRFEDLFSKERPEEEYQRILDFCGISPDISAGNYFSKSINVSHSKSISEWRSWSDELCQRVQYLCAEGMNKYQYGHEIEWQEKLANYKGTK